MHRGESGMPASLILSLAISLDAEKLGSARHVTHGPNRSLVCLFLFLYALPLHHQFS